MAPWCCRPIASKTQEHVEIVLYKGQAERGARALTAAKIAYFFPYLVIVLFYAVALSFAMVPGPVEEQRGNGGTLWLSG